jgi:hypothetical protein
MDRELRGPCVDEFVTEVRALVEEKLRRHDMAVEIELGRGRGAGDNDAQDSPRPSGVIAEVRELARQHTREAVDTLMVLEPRA